MVCWTTAEGTLRLIARQHQIDLTECSPAAIVSKMYSMGIYGRAEYDIMQGALHFRNLLVHGYTSQRDSKTVEQLIMVLEGLLNSQ